MVKKYAIDANILIGSGRNYYSFEIAPAFWSQLVEKGSEKIILVDAVRDEIYKNEDRLTEWLKENEKSFIIGSSEDEKVIETYTKVITTIELSTRYYASAKAYFAGNADSWLCAHALAHGYTIVTQEKYEPNSKKIVKIPNVCKKFAMNYIDQFRFMKEIGIRLV